MRIAQISDTHLYKNKNLGLKGYNSYYNLEKIFKELEKENIDLLLHTGDISEDQTEETYIYIRDFVKQLGVEYHLIYGNHDNHHLFNKYFLPKQFIEKKDVTVIFLNSVILNDAKGFVEENEVTFAVQMASIKKNILIALHHNPILTGVKAIDKYCLINYREFKKALLPCSNNILGVIFGHIHHEMDVIDNKVRYISAPSTCYQAIPNSDTNPGYRIIEINDGKLDTYVKRIEAIKNKDIKVKHFSEE